MTYEQAVELAKKKEDAGIGFLYESTYRDKYYIALKYMKNEEDARDVLQDAYIKAFSSLDTLDNAGKFPAWLGMIVANTAKNALKKKKPALFSEMNAETEDGDGLEFQIEDERIEGQPELSYTKEETRELVQQMISALSDEQRLCILMFYIEDMSIRDIAEAIDCSENTVKSRLNYGRKNLKAKAEELQKKGYQLYGIAPLPLLIYLLREERMVYFSQMGAANLPINQKVLGHMKNKKVMKNFLHTVAGKVTVAAVTAAVIVGTIAVVVYNQSPSEAETAERESTRRQKSIEEQESTEGNTKIAGILDEEENPMTESSGESPQASEPIWKTAYTEVVNDPGGWLLDTQCAQNASFSEKVESGFYFQELQNEASAYQYTLFDINQDGMPELIINSHEQYTGFEDWFFCTYDEADGVYLIDAQALDFRSVLAIYEDNLTWRSYYSYQPEMSIAPITMTPTSIERSDDIYYGLPESAPETEDIEWHSAEDTDYIFKYAGR